MQLIIIMQEENDEAGYLTRSDGRRFQRKILIFLKNLRGRRKKLKKEDIGYEEQKIRDDVVAAKPSYFIYFI